MQEGALRKILLIQAIEETDHEGAVLPLAERTTATRTAAGNNLPDASLSAGAESFLLRRAEILLQVLRSRSPGIDHFLAVASGATSLDRGTLLSAFALGFLGSWLDGHRGLNIFALPLVALIAWNVLVYAMLLGRTRNPQRPTLLGRLYAGRVRRHVDNLLEHSTHFNVQLAPGLRRFAADWWDLSQPLLFIRARRLLHTSAAVVALGLAVGYYVRACVLRSSAGWVGTGFVGPQTAHALLMALYGPASLLSGVPIPGADTLAQMRWSDPAVMSSPATSWAHLIAWTAAFYIVLPRLIAATVAAANLWRASRRLAVPPGVVGYLRTLLAR